MAKDLLHSISEGMSGFSKGQKLIARYIIENYDKAAFMTASKLGNTVGVSESTVVRFATEVGFEGYPQLQRALQELIRNRLTAVQRMEVTSEQMGEHDILSKVLTMDIEKIRRTLEEQSNEGFEAVADSIIAAKNIYILGIRSSAALAQFMSFYFNQIFPNVRLVTGSRWARTMSLSASASPGTPSAPSRPSTMPRSGGPLLLPSPIPPVRRWLPSVTICCWPGAIWPPLWIRWLHR